MHRAVNRDTTAKRIHGGFALDVFALLVVWALFCVGVGALANSRGRSGFGFFLVSFLLSPLLGLVIVLVTKDLAAQQLEEERRRRDEQSRDSDRKREHEKQIESLRAVTLAQPAVASPPGKRSSVDDELSKLAALVDGGHLTKEEFSVQKARLLGSTDVPQMPRGNLFWPNRTPENTERLEKQFSSPEACKSFLISIGCGVAQPSEGVWEVLQPSGVTAYARSEEAFRELAIKHATEPPSPGAA